MAAIKNSIFSLKLSAYHPSRHLLYLNIKEYGVKTLPRVSYQDFYTCKMVRRSHGNIDSSTIHLERSRVWAYLKTYFHFYL